VSDFGDVMVATNGSWTLTANAAALSKYNWVGANTNTTDWAAYRYLGYGFQFWAYTGPAMGKANLVLDGTVLTTIDFYSAGSTQRVMLWQQLAVPLGVHLVQLVATNTKNGASSANTVAWDALKVMR